MQQNVAAYTRRLSETWEELPPYFVTSSEERTGKEEVLGYIGDILKSLETA